MKKMICGRSYAFWIKSFPLIKNLMAEEECFWVNDHKLRFEDAIKECPFDIEDVKDASDRLDRFAPYIAKAFPETKETSGIIESPIKKIDHFIQALSEKEKVDIQGEMYAKLDSELPISGSIKARGGIYEVLKHAEELAVEAGMLSLTDDYACLAEERFRDFFSEHRIAVGSTGNLGLSIGIMSAKLGFDVTVHMSADARQWKKDKLRGLGVHVIEYEDDYSVAVKNGREKAAADPRCYFVDDENSKSLFMGYTVAALRLKKQLEEEKIIVDAEHPLFVYLPCGVGGGPGGVAFGLKMLYGDHVHCFFAEPTHSPCMLLGMYTGEFQNVSVQDFGLNNLTAADGLAVGRCSSFVGSLMRPFISGSYTVEDARLFRDLALMMDTEGVRLEPSALAGAGGPVRLFRDGTSYLKKIGFTERNVQPTHLMWATGGRMVPVEDMNHYYETGKQYL